MLTKIVRFFIPLWLAVSLLLMTALPVAGAGAPTVISQYPAKNATGVSVGVKPYINFSKAMLSSTINTANIQLMNGSTSIPVTVSLSGTRKAIITPTAELDSNTSYYIVVGTGVQDSTGVPLATAYGSASVSGFTTAAPRAPTLISQYPARGAINVSRTVEPYVNFSKAMDYTTINSTNIQLMQNGSAVPASVILSGTNRAVITPDAPLNGNTVYYIVVTTGVKDTTGLPLASNYGSATNSRFTTAVAVPPVIVSVYPADNATGVPLKAQPYINFSKSMNSSTINSTNIQLLDGSTPVAISVHLANYTRVIVTPAAALNSNTVYTLVVGTGVMDAFGNNLASEYTTTFTSDNSIPPAILSVYPANTSTAITVNVQPCLIFSEVIDPSTLNTTNIKLLKGSNLVRSTVARYGSKIAIITPQSPLVSDSVYSIVVTTGIKDTSGNSMVSQSTTTFTTGSADLPVVISQSPNNGTTDVAVSIQPCVVFSREMNPSTINATNIQLKSGNATIRSTVSLYGQYTAVISPQVPLSCGATYYIVVNNAVKDIYGNSPAAVYGSAAASSFTTVNRALTVQSQYPVDNSTGESINVQPCLVFSNALNESTVNDTNIQLLNGTTPVSISVELCDEKSVIITPAAALNLNTEYTIWIGTGVMDTLGQAVSTEVNSTFTTATANIAPTVAYLFPADSATDIPLDAQICLAFSRTMDASSVTTANIQLLDGSNPVAISVALYGNNTVIITPSADLTANTVYTLEISSGVRDNEGNTMESATFTFTTVNP